MAGRHSEQAATRGEPGYVWRSGQDRRLNMIRAWSDLSGRILDNGCGLGTYLAALAPFSPHRFGLEVELDRAVKALPKAQGIVQAVGEAVPFPPNTFNVILSNEVIEHVDNDRRALEEMVRTVKPGGRIIIFCPNRWYPVEQHGIFWRGRYKFGNIPLVNYLPNPLRNRLAPHVRTYSAAALHRLYQGLPVRKVHYSRIFGGYDNIENRRPRLGRLLKKALYTLEKTPFSLLALSHFLVLEKLTDPYANS